MATTPQQQGLDPMARRVLSIVAVLGAILGLGLVARVSLGSAAAYAVQTEVTAGDVSVWVENSRWLNMDMDGDDENGAIEGAREGDGHEQSDGEEQDEAEESNEGDEGELGFAMPASMMPGAPTEGFQRLQVSVSLRNRGAGGADVEPGDFLLVANDGDSWLTLLGGTFGLTTLGPGQAVSTVVAFDVPVESASSDMNLVWAWQGGETRFTIPGSEGGHHG